MFGQVSELLIRDFAIMLYKLSISIVRLGEKKEITVRHKGCPEINALKTLAIVIAIGFAAAPSWSESPLPAPLDSYHDRRFDISMVRCVSRPVAVCTINVTAKVDSVWDISSDNMLVDSDGVAIPAVSMTIGGTEISIPSRNSQRMLAGVPTKIDIKFRAQVEPNDAKFLIVYVGHWSAKTIRLQPNWVR